MCQLDQLEAAAAGVQLAHLLANAVNEGIEEFLIQPSTNELQAAQAFLQIQVSSKSLWLHSTFTCKSKYYSSNDFLLPCTAAATLSYKSWQWKTSISIVPVFAKKIIADYTIE